MSHNQGGTLNLNMKSAQKCQFLSELIRDFIFLTCFEQTHQKWPFCGLTEHILGYYYIWPLFTKYTLKCVLLAQYRSIFYVCTKMTILSELIRDFFHTTLFEQTDHFDLNLCLNRAYFRMIQLMTPHHIRWSKKCHFSTLWIHFLIVSQKLIFMGNNPGFFPHYTFWTNYSKVLTPYLWAKITPQLWKIHISVYKNTKTQKCTYFLTSEFWVKNVFLKLSQKCKFLSELIRKNCDTKSTFLKWKKCCFCNYTFLSVFVTRRHDVSCTQTTLFWKWIASTTQAVRCTLRIQMMHPPYEEKWCNHHIGTTPLWDVPTTCTQRATSYCIVSLRWTWQRWVTTIDCRVQRVTVTKWWWMTCRRCQ